MDDKHPPGSPPPKRKKATSKSARPARRDSPNKPGAPPGTPVPMGPPTHLEDPAADELAYRYAGSSLTEIRHIHALAPLISEHLPAPSLQKGINPESISQKQLKKGFKALIPSSDCLMPGDTLILMWGSKCYEPHSVTEDNLKQKVLTHELIIHSELSFLPQGRVKVCYDVHRDGQRIGTSAILGACTHETYETSDKQVTRKKNVKRKSQRRPTKG
jgi:hypothetical protein